MSEKAKTEPNLVRHRKSEAEINAYFAENKASIEGTLSDVLDDVIRYSSSGSSDNPLIRIGLKLLEAQGIDTSVIQELRGVARTRHDQSNAASALDIANMDGIAEALTAAREASTSDVSLAQGWQLSDWLDSLHPHTIIVQALCKPIAQLLSAVPRDRQGAVELAYLRALGRYASVPTLLSLLQSTPRPLAGRLLEEAKQLVDRPATAAELSKKFVQDGELHYGRLEHFHGGIHAVVGSPNPNLGNAILDEHSKRIDSHSHFEANNYGKLTSSRLSPPRPVTNCLCTAGVHTTSYTEYLFVVAPAEGISILGIIHYPIEKWPSCGRSDRMRQEINLESLIPNMEKINARLQQSMISPMRREEVISARLYTGPLFIKYNAVLRGSSPDSPSFAAEAFEKFCMGNRYSTTVRCHSKLKFPLSNVLMIVCTSLRRSTLLTAPSLSFPRSLELQWYTGAWEGVVSQSASAPKTSLRCKEESTLHSFRVPLIEVSQLNMPHAVVSSWSSSRGWLIAVLI